MKNHERLLFSRTAESVLGSIRKRMHVDDEMTLLEIHLKRLGLKLNDFAATDENVLKRQLFLALCMADELELQGAATHTEQRARDIEKQTFRGAVVQSYRLLLQEIRARDTGRMTPLERITLAELTRQVESLEQLSWRYPVEYAFFLLAYLVFVLTASAAGAYAIILLSEHIRSLH